MDLDFKGKVNLYYVDIPLTLKASHHLGEGIKMFGAVGPYAGLGIYGTLKATAEYQGTEVTEEEEIEWGPDEENDYLRRFDMGMTFGGGIEVKSFMLGISYDLGLSNNSAYQLHTE